MQPRRIGPVVIVLSVMAVTCFLGARSVAQEMAMKNFERDAIEFDRTRDRLAADLVAKGDWLKQVAQSVSTLESDAEQEKELERKIESVFQELFQDAYVLAIQTHLLAMDHKIDRGGPAAEEAILTWVADRVQVPRAEIADWREQTELGIGGVVLGYAIARAAKSPVGEIFAGKQANQSWLEVMKSRQVSVQQVVAIFEDD